MQIEFRFAGFSWPRNIARMVVGFEAMKAKRETRKVCGEYFHAPKPENAGTGKGFYLNDAGQPFTRWAWCDEVEQSIRHTGWFTDEYGIRETIRGIVVRLPHGKFLAGWSMGEHMVSSVGAEIFTDELSAALAADSMAESAAENEQEYNFNTDDDDRE